ncbi:MAG: hypothetical protein H6659_04440 [Ardenticatenaceae bacterium]|nr:hypothetical protein [Ardenticatenaceae bacterium]MCB8987656.1 hypothetical protein [Ardenticatenaceae bacterium]
MAMKAVKQHVHGRLIQANGRAALLLIDLNPTEETAVSLYLRYALVVMGPEDHVLPALLLDDWGNEIRGLEIYQFIREHGDDFPRAEVFGFDLDGSETQLFLRSLELHMRWPCYVYTSADEPLAQGVRLHAVLLPTAGIDAPLAVDRPDEEAIARPLRAAQVNWWQVPPHTESFAFGLEDG